MRRDGDVHSPNACNCSAGGGCVRARSFRACDRECECALGIGDVRVAVAGACIGAPQHRAGRALHAARVPGSLPQRRLSAVVVRSGHGGDSHVQRQRPDGSLRHRRDDELPGRSATLSCNRGRPMQDIASNREIDTRRRLQRQRAPGDDLTDRHQLKLLRGAQMRFTATSAPSAMARAPERPRVLRRVARLRRQSHQS